MIDAPEIECTDCDGYGFTMKRDSRLGPGIEAFDHDLDEALQALSDKYQAIADAEEEI